MSVNPVISEFMASNSTALTDYYGKNPDWLEIYNPDTAVVNLSGWKLKDNNTVWSIPANVTIPANDYLTIFCDKRDTIAPNGELHTNFNLGASGDYLELLKPDNTVVSEYAPQYPQQYTDISYGLAMESTTTTLVNSGSTGKWTVPTAALPSNWNTTSYSDAAWTSGSVPLGYNYDLPSGGNYYYGQYGTNNTWNLYEVVSAGTTWTSAYTAAKAKSVAGVAGHLVTLTSAAELTFVKNLTNASIWIGLTDDPAYGGTEYGNTSGYAAPTEGLPTTSTQRGAGFVWCNGEAFTYHNNVWESGEPRGDGNYVRMATNGQWNDRTNNYSNYAYVIEYDLQLLAQPSSYIIASNANGFSVLEKHSSGQIPDINTAVDFLNNGTGTNYNYNASVINYSDPEDAGVGNYSGDSSFGGNSSNDDDYFALQIHGTVTIPSSGAWTFGVASDDGFRLKLTGATFNTLTNCTNSSGTDTIEYSGIRGADNSLGAINNLAAGTYDFDLTYFESTGGSSLEFFAASGAKTAFDSSFRLVGDIANGGLGLVHVSNVVGSANPTFSSTAFNKNSSAFLRVPFTISNPINIASLILNLKFDDGFVAYLNGVEIARINAADPLTWNSAATADHFTGDAVRYEQIDVSDFKDKLLIGTNVLSFQILNTSATDGNMLLLPQLVAISYPALTTNQRFFALPSPGSVNGVGTSDLGPMVTDVSVPITQPGDSDNIVVTAAVRKTISNIATSSVTLHYRVMYDTEHTLPMYDDGAHGDGAAADGVYGATIPASASVPGQMVRWYVTAADTNGRTGRWPVLVPIVGNDGGPEYEGTVIADSTLTSTLPIFQSFIVNPAAADNWENRVGSRASVFYLGRFYDNVFVRCRGGYTTFGNKFEFNSGYDFIFAEDQEPVKEINLNGQGNDSTYIRPVLAFDTYREVGVPTSICFGIHVERNNSYFGVMNFVEQVDNHFLDRNDLYDKGALYKCNPGEGWTPGFTNANAYEKKNRDEEGNGDLQAFLDGLQLTGDALRTFLYDNVNIPEMLDFMVGNILTNNMDNWHKNYYLYRDTNDGANAAYGNAYSQGTNQWSMFPWDMDWTFGVAGGVSTYGLVDPQAHPFLGNSQHPSNYSASLYSRFTDDLLSIPEIKQMFLRRLRTAMDELLQPPGTPYANLHYEQRIDELYNIMMGDPGLKNQVGDVKALFDELKNDYFGYRNPTFPGRREHLYVDHGLNTSYPDYAGIPAAQVQNRVINFGAFEVSPTSGNQNQEYLTLVNPNNFAVDLSGWKLTGGISLTFKEGVVIPAGGMLYVSPNVYAFRQRTTGPTGGQNLLVQGNYDGHLSMWGEAVQLVDLKDNIVATLTTSSTPSQAQQFLRITEVMYHPAEPTSGSYTSDDFQFIELKNTSATQTINLTGVRFTDGIIFDFTGSSVTSLAPGAKVLVVSNLTALQSRYGTGLNGIIAGQFAKAVATDLSTTHLSKSGEKITLVDAVGETIQSFSYEDNWFKQSDGSGNSLVIRDAMAADRNLWGQREGWFASHAPNGSPGTDETPDYAIDAIVVSEILSHTDATNPGDWVEFYNTTNAPIAIGGWYLSDTNNDLKKYQIAAGTVIPAYGYVTFNHHDHFGNTSDPGFKTEFSFDEYGGTVYLTSASGGVLSTYQFSQDFDDNDRDRDGTYPYHGNTSVTFSFARYTKSTGGTDFVETTQSTYNAPNTAPRVGPVVINEVNYHPTPGNASYIELKNLTAQAVNLYDPDHADPLNPSKKNTWKLSGGVDFVFPQGATIPANGYALVVNSDPTWFRTRYSVPAAVPIYGAYWNELSNGGDSIELDRPGEPDASPTKPVPYYRVDKVTYEDGGLWPKSADSFGASLNRITAAAYGNDVANWTAGRPTPGVDNAAFVANPVTLTAPATATPGIVTGNKTSLSVTATSIYDTSNLLYDWSVTSMPTGASYPTFSANDTNAANNTAATFYKAGTYTITARITDIYGASITSSVNVTVIKTQTSVGIVPGSLTLTPSETRQFALATLDQFGNAMGVLPGVTWSASAGAMNSTTGLYTAPAASNPSITITALSGGNSTSITVQVVTPYAWWKLNESSGTSTDDASGNSRTGTLSGSPLPTWTTGIFNNALEFNGTNDAVSANSLNLNSNTVTISAWIKRNGDNVDWGPIVFVRGGATCAGLGFGGGGSNELRYHWDGEQWYWSTGMIVPDNTWTFIGLVVQSDRATVYMKPIDAAMQSAVNIVSHPAEEFDTTTWIGQDPLGGRYFRGTIDEVRVYNSSLSADSMAAMADRPPVNIALSNASIVENQSGGVVGALTTTDPGGGESFAYLLLSDPANKFEIVGSSLKLKNGQSFDFETTPSVVVTIRSIDSGGLYFDKTFTITVVNTSEMMLVAATDWTAANTLSATLQLAADGKLHIYKTGTTTDIVPPQLQAYVTGIDVTGNNTTDVLVVDSMSAGVPSLVMHNATLTIDQNNAISANTSVTIDAGVLDFRGFTDTTGMLTIINGGSATVDSLTNNAAIVSGVLTADSIICNSLTIGGTSSEANPSIAAASGTALAKNQVESVPVSGAAPVSSDIADDRSTAGVLPFSTPLFSPMIEEQPIPGDMISTFSSSSAAGDHATDPPPIEPAGAIASAISHVGIPFAVSMASPWLPNDASGSSEASTFNSTLQSRNNLLATSDKHQSKSVEVPVANWFSEQRWDEENSRLLFVKQEEPVIVENSVRHFPGARSNGQQPRFIAFRSGLDEYRESNSDGYTEKSYNRRDRLRKKSLPAEAAVDAVFSLDDIFTMD